MKKGWQNISFGELGRVFNGNSISEAEKKAHFEGVEDGVPYIGTKDVSFEHEVAYESGVKIPDDKRDGFKLAPANTVLVCAEGGSAGRKIAHTDREIYFGNKLFAVCPSPPISSRLIFYYCLSGDFTKQFKGSMAGLIGGVSINKFKELSVPVPPLAEQQRIVGLLDEAFDGLATAKANAERNLQNARALFEIHLQSVFTQRGPGWVETTIGDQLTLQRGFDITKVQQNTGEVPVVSSGGIKSYHDKAMAKGPGVVIGRKGTLGKVFYTESDYWPHDTTLWVKDFKGNEPRFVYYLFAGLNVKKLDSGAANPALNRNQVHPIEVTWPQVAQQKALVETLDALEEETQRLARLYERKHAALEALKKSLLHQAFTGAL